MRKLRLDLSALHVESFEAHARADPAAGTVRGNADEPISQGPTCDGERCVETACATCLCPYSGPMPSCDPCSMFGDCPSLDPATCV